VVYLYNFKALPLDRTPMPTEYLTNIIAFANIGLSGFLATSLAARFVYPAIGAEGMAFAMIRSSPLPMERYFACKYLFYWIPFTLISLVLIIASNTLLQVEGPMWWISIIISLIITWTALAMALGFGAMYADFKIESRAAAQGSFGAILFLFTGLTVEMLLLSLGFMGSLPLIRTWLRGNYIDSLAVLESAVTLVTLAALGFSIAHWCLKKGIKSLAE
jgi:ABC-2 type transport system permease protein